MTSAVIACAVLLQFAVAAYFYPVMPEVVASHWGFSGGPDGYAPKLLALFALPVMTAAIVALLVAVPRIDPLGANVRKFRKQYDTFVAMIALLMLAMQAYVVLWNSGVQVSMNLLMPAVLSAMYFYTGVMLGHSRRNWFIGIRTPWTMSSDAVWQSTHRRAAKLFKAAAVVTLAGVALPAYAIWFVLVPVLFAAAYSVIYSYFEYSKTRPRSGHG